VLVVCLLFVVVVCSVLFVSSFLCSLCHFFFVLVKGWEYRIRIGKEDSALFGVCWLNWWFFFLIVAV